MITAMEAPARYEPEQVRNEKVKVLKAVRLLDAQDVAQQTVRGQYDGYLQEKDVPADSQTATFAAVKLHVDNWRWQGVPFYLRSGKAMSCRTTQIVVQFRRPPHMLFNSAQDEPFEGNRWMIQIQPKEGIQLQFQTKVPDAGMDVRLSDLDFRFQRQFAEDLPDAYQRLLLDAMHGDASLFARSDEVELAWQIVDPIIQAWEATNEPALGKYGEGFWGPDYSTDWMRSQGREWFDACPVFGLTTVYPRRQSDLPGWRFAMGMQVVGKARRRKSSWSASARDLAGWQRVGRRAPLRFPLALRRNSSW